MGAGRRGRRGGAGEPLLVDARAHWLLLCRPLAALLGALAAATAVVVAFPGAPDGVGLTLGALLALALGLAGARAVRVRAARVLVTPARVVLEDGLLRRRRRVLSLRGVTGVTLRQGPIERLLGAGTIALREPGGSEATLPLLGRARRLQDLLERLAGAPGSSRIVGAVAEAAAGGSEPDSAWLDELHRRGVLTSAEWAAARGQAPRSPR